jgi:cell division protein FtsA
VERSLVLGVDAGSANVAAVLADLAEGAPRIIGIGLVPTNAVRRGLVVDLAGAARSIQEAVSQACAMAGHTGVTRAVVAVSGGHIRSVAGSAEVAVLRPAAGVTPADVRRGLDAAAAVELEPGREVIHVVPRRYRLDGAEGVMNPVGLTGRMLQVEANLITGESLPLRNYLLAAREAGLEVVDYQLAIRAAGEAVLTREEREAGVLLLDIGAGTTGVAVYDRGHLWHAGVIPVGGDHITADIATLLHMPVAAAERLKIERGWASAGLAPDGCFELVSPSGHSVREVADKQLAEIIESRVQEILQLAAREVKRSGYPGLFPAGLVLTGGTAKLNGLVTAAADALGLPARVGTAGGTLAEDPVFATAVGLVAWGSRLVQEEAAAAAEAAKRDHWGRVRNWLKSLFG